MEKQFRDLLVSFGALFYARGYAVGSGGNLSLRLPNGSFLATPTSSCLGRLEPERLAKISPAGIQLSGDPMSKEVPFHLALYQQRKDCQAVVHLHSSYLTALSCCANLDSADAIRPFTPYYVMKVGRLPLLPYFPPGSPRIAEEIGQRAQESRAFLLANHGAVVCGASLEEAALTMEELEETAKLFFILRGSDVSYLAEGEISALKSPAV